MPELRGIPDNCRKYLFLKHSSHEVRRKTQCVLYKFPRVKRKLLCLANVGLTIVGWLVAEHDPARPLNPARVVILGLNSPAYGFSTSFALRTLRRGQSRLAPETWRRVYTSNFFALRGRLTSDSRVHGDPRKNY